MSGGKLTEQAKGVYIIAATPFTDDGALDLQSVDTLTDFYLGCGVHGFTLLGIMGEAHKLTTEESIDVVKRVIARGGDRQVIVGVSHAGIENVRRLAHEVMIAGAAGVMVAPPAGLKGDDGISITMRRYSPHWCPTSLSSIKITRKRPASIYRPGSSNAWSTISGNS